MSEDTPVNKFGKILRELRKEQNLTQEDVSIYLETDRSNIANYERGKRLPPLESLIKISRFFNVSLDYLVLGKERIEDSSDTDMVKRELMAENTALMEESIRLHDTLKEKEDEVDLLKELVESLRNYNSFLEGKIKQVESRKE